MFAMQCKPCTVMPQGCMRYWTREIALCLLQELAAKYGVLLKDAGIALRGLFLINPEVPCDPAAHPCCMTTPSAAVQDLQTLQHI